jgi:hypothetical protein
MGFASTAKRSSLPEVPAASVEPSPTFLRPAARVYVFSTSIPMGLRRPLKKFWTLAATHQLLNVT